MQKLCCLPLSDTPSVDVNLKCTSSCCGSRMSNSQRNVDSTDFYQNSQKKEKEKEKREKSKSCCCYSMKRLKQGNSHANAEDATEPNDE